jgi:tetratricopeptide (TPR) repeat protein
MKHRMFLMILFITLYLDKTTLATSQEDFLRANQWYLSGDYLKAKKFYDSIENKGAAVWFNLGNCCYHLEQYPEALAYWKRSLKTGGKRWRDDVLYNCQHVQEVLSVQQPQKWSELLTRVVADHSLLWWQLVLILLGIIGTAMLFLYKKRKKVPVVVFFVVLCITTSCLGIKYWHLSQEHAIVAYESGLMAGTDERFSKIAILKKGLEVFVIQKQEKWTKVVTNEGAGWIMADALITI